MRDYIEKYCGISIKEEKVYLLETRLGSLMTESGCSNFRQFHRKAVDGSDGKLREKIIDAMTTNETLWFRDSSPFVILDDVLLKEFHEQVRSGKKSKIRIWSAACSTGQEPYSIAMTIHDYIKAHSGISSDKFEIVATDISPTVLFTAMAGRYDGFAISRGLPGAMLDRYFTQSGNVWIIKDQIKRMVQFKKLNLQDNFSTIGKPDLIFCRNVLIYFSEEFKKNILRRMASLLRPGGYLFLGASESINNYSAEYEMHRHSRGLYYRVRE
ncbi:Chemotaxis protein methyltransferase CheR [Chitinispirillum alkaliphilum]|nr:Chemotaxis protein methyltransferase CheR [Chitinispirillum alkaliphilum]